MFKLQDINEKIRKQRKLAEERDAKRRAKKYRLPYLDLTSVKTPTELNALALVPEEEARNGKLAVIQKIQKKIFVTVFDSENLKTKDLLNKLKIDFDVKIFITSMSGLNHAWKHYKFVQKEDTEISGRIEIDSKNLKNIYQSIKKISDLNLLIKSFKDPSTSKILEIILGGALATGASDIHLEPQKNGGSIRLRIDGLLHTIYDNFSVSVYKSIIMRIKLLSETKLNITDQAQDGRFTIDLEKKDIEIRTSVIPSEYGETIVMRLLDPSALKTNLEELGWRDDDLDIIKNILKHPNGLILNTGPTGSGKTTTLYAFLKKVRKTEIKIITVEDPIEYHLDGISQTQVNEESDYTFANGLRSILRQDPDIVLVGEIRDEETAEISLNASLTGHLVFSTLHTNDAVGAIPRLIDLGIKPQILGPALTLIIAQRLVRVLCNECKQKKEISDETKEKIKSFVSSLPDRVNKNDYKEINIYDSVGCPICGGIGYKGRVSIFELFLITENIEKEIYKNPTEIILKYLAKKEGMITMQEDGLLKAINGITSLDEIKRLTGEISWFKDKKISN